MSTYPVKGYNVVDLKLEKEYAEWSPGGGIKTWRGFLAWKERCVAFEKAQMDARVKAIVEDVNCEPVQIQFPHDRLASVVAQMKTGKVSCVLPVPPEVPVADLIQLKQAQDVRGLVCYECKARKEVGLFSDLERTRGQFAVCCKCALLLAALLASPVSDAQVLPSLCSDVASCVDYYVDRTGEVVQYEKIVYASKTVHNYQHEVTPYNGCYEFSFQEPHTVCQVISPFANVNVLTAKWTELSLSFRTVPGQVWDDQFYRLVLVQHFCPPGDLFDRPNGMFWDEPHSDPVRLIRKSPNWNVLVDTAWNIRVGMDDEGYSTHNFLVLKIDVGSIPKRRGNSHGNLMLMIISPFYRDHVEVELQVCGKYQTGMDLQLMEPDPFEYHRSSGKHPANLMFSHIPTLDWGRYVPDHPVDGLVLNYYFHEVQSHELPIIRMMVMVAYGDHDCAMQELLKFMDSDYVSEPSNSDMIMIADYFVTGENSYRLNIPLKFMFDQSRVGQLMFYLKLETACPSAGTVDYSYEFHNVGSGWPTQC